jgi:hypothetical protein
MRHFTHKKRKDSSFWDTRTYILSVWFQSLGILGSVPAAWLILTLLVLLIYLLTRCCDRKPRPSRSISALKVSLAIVSVLCCAAVGLGLYGNDDLHNGVVRLLDEGRQVDILVSKIRNQTEAIERQLRVQAGAQLVHLRDIFDEPVMNMTLYKQALGYLEKTIQNNSIAANAAADIRQPLIGMDLMPKISAGEKVEAIRWPLTMAILSVLLILCVILLVSTTVEIFLRVYYEMKIPSLDTHLRNKQNENVKCTFFESIRNYDFFTISD